MKIKVDQGKVLKKDSGIVFLLNLFDIAQNTF